MKRESWFHSPFIYIYRQSNWQVTTNCIILRISLIYTLALETCLKRTFSQIKTVWKYLRKENAWEHLVIEVSFNGTKVSTNRIKYLRRIVNYTTIGLIKHLMNIANIAEITDTRLAMAPKGKANTQTFAVLRNK